VTENTGTNDIANRIKSRLIAVGLSAQKASKLAGLSNDGIRNILRHQDQGPRAATINKLAPILKTTSEYLLTGTTPAAPIYETANIPVIGRVAAGVWLEEDEDMAQEPMGYIPFSIDTRHKNKRQYARKVEGESMNMICPNNSFVVIAASNNLPRDGDIVIVKRTNGHLVERTLKRVREIEGNVELHPESTDKNYKKISLEATDGIEIEIEGYAIGVYVPF
jgi:SOS-response transcriptional repressor LexA